MGNINGEKALATLSTNLSNTPMAQEHRRLCAKMATILFRSYRTAGADTPESFLAAVVAVLEAYAPDVVRQVCDPVRGIPSQMKFMPSIAEIREACEEATRPIARNAKRDAALREQFELRAKCEEFDNNPNKQSYEDFCAEMAARGMPIRRKDKDAAAFSAEHVQAKLGITPEQWAAWPATNAVEWDKVR